MPTTNRELTKGDLLVRDRFGLERLGVGSDSQVATADSTQALGIKWGAAGGGGGDSFKTINCPSGTDPVADSATDTLQFIAGAGVAITGDAAADSVEIKADTYIAVATQSITAATQAITATDGSPYRPVSANAAYTLSAEPTIAAGRNGQVILVKNVGSNNVTLQDVNALGGSLLRLTANTLTIQPGGTMKLVYDSTLGFWVQQYLLNPQSFTPSVSSFTVDGSSSPTHEWGDGSTANDTAPVFAVGYVGAPSAASVTLTVAPDPGYPLTLISPFTGGTGAQYFRSATRNGTRTFRVTATVAGQGGLTRDVVVTYRAANYVGVNAEATALTSAQINALANVVLDTDPYGSYAVVAGASDYVWCAFVDGDALPFFVVSGERAGFTLKQNAFSHTTAHLKVQTYDTYRSDIVNLGSVTVVAQSSDGQVRNYFGTSTQTTVLTSAQILALVQSALDTNAYNSWSSIASGASDYLWFAHPSSYTDPFYQETSSGERAGFTVKQTAFSHQNQYGYTLSGGYDTARSDIVDMPTAAYTTSSTRPPTRRYIGKAATTGPLSEATIEGLQLNDLTESPNGTFASITGLATGQSVWFCASNANVAAPANFGLSPGNGSTGYQRAAFTAAALVNVTNVYGYAEDYRELYSNVSELQAVNINGATNTTWSLKTQDTAFNNRIYMGPSTDAGPSIANANLLALDDTSAGESNLNTTVGGTYTAISIVAGSYLWFCHPDAVPDLATIKDAVTGFAIAGSYRNNITHVNDFGVSEAYRCWRSDNTGIFPSPNDVVVT